jgi:hypothetical protein
MNIKEYNDMNKNKCPLCNNKLVDIVYGMPGPDLFEAYEKKQVALGGCVIYEDEEQPVYHCYHCNKDFFKNMKEDIDEYDFISHFEKNVIVKLIDGSTVEGFCESFTRAVDSESDLPELSISTKKGLIGVTYNEVFEIEDK